MVRVRTDRQKNNYKLNKSTYTKTHKGSEWLPIVDESKMKKIGGKKKAHAFQHRLEKSWKTRKNDYTC